MNLIGLAKRNTMCKICNGLDDENLNAITVDILTERKTREEIKEYYSKFLPDFIPPINNSNINSHKRHSDPALIAKEVLEKQDKAITEADHAAVQYAERFQGVFDKHDTLRVLYIARINSIQWLRDLLDDKKKEYNDLQVKVQTKDKDYVTNNAKLKILEREIRNFTAEIDEIERDLQRVIVQDKRVDQGPGHTFINQNFVNIFEGGLKNFMNELIPYLLYNIFSDDIEKGKEVVSQISAYMDQHLSPSLNKLNKQLQVMN